MRDFIKQFSSLLLSSSLLAAGCQTGKGPVAAVSTSKAPATPGASAEFDKGRYFSEPVHLKNLTVWPIHAAETVETGRFMTLKEAEERGLAEIREVGARVQAGAETQNREQTVESLLESFAALNSIGDAATVNQLVIENKGDTPILVCGGTVVKGGKQDRQIGQDFVIAPKTSVPVEAFCVEQGRWTAVRDGKPTAGMFLSQSYLAPNAVRASAQYKKNQSLVWKSVAKANSLADMAPATSTLLAATEEADGESRKRRSDYEKAVREHFNSLPKEEAPVGFAYSINGKPVTVRTFANHPLFEGHFDSFLKTMGIEADLALRKLKPEEKESAMARGRIEAVLDSVRMINEEKESVAETTAANRNGVRKSGVGGNSNCYYDVPQLGKPTTISQDWTMTAED